MICRLWRGWTTRQNADAYDSYYRNELIPSLCEELSRRGYHGYHLLRLPKGSEVEFVSLLWFESIESVRAFAGETYEKAIISEKALALLSRYSERCEHYELSGSSWLTGS